MSLPADWARLSPLLDELLDLAEPQRAARLADLRAQDAALADELAELLARDAALGQSGFLATPAVPVLADLLSAGQQIGPYTLERLLGEGGMGSVWLARRSDGRFDGQVAIKFLRAGLLGAGDADRFAREGAILARLTHPHIARLLDAGVARGGTLPYLVLEYVDGQPIDRWCDAHGLDVRARVRLVCDVLAAVAHAHNRLILHRDLKPSNILVTADGRALLLDFGVAKLLSGDGLSGAATELTQRAGAAFTPHYAAPEQLQGAEVTTATDVYAMGVLLHGLLGGGHPTSQATASSAERLRQMLQGPTRALSEAVRARLAGEGGTERAELRRRVRELRGDLDTIVGRALKQAPAQRYANAAALADDLQRWLAHEPIAARPDSRWYVAAKFVRRHRLAVAAASLSTAVLTLALGTALHEGREARRQRDQAEGLVEFMLGDLRRKLQPVGRLDVLDAVGERVLARYAAEPPEQLDADALGRRARAQHLLGELADKRGRQADAALRFEEAALSTALLLAREPRNGQRLFDHAQSAYWLGYIARRRGQPEQAEREFGRYLALAEQLLAVDPQRPDAALERAYAWQSLGVVRLEAGRIQDALAVFNQARAVFAADAARRPDNVSELATSLGWIAVAHVALGDFAQARVAQRDKVAALQRLPGADKVARVQQQLVEAWRELGLYARQGDAPDVAAATEALNQAWQHSQRLLALDADNLDWLAQSVLVRVALAEHQRSTADTAAARQQLLAARSSLQRLLRTDARKLYWQVDLQTMVLQQALAQGLATVDEAAQVLAQIRQRQAAEGLTLDTMQRINIAKLSVQVADALVANGQAAQAQRQWLAVQQELATAGQGSDSRAVCLRGLALLGGGALQAARAVADPLGAPAMRHPVCADLRRRLAAAS